MKKFFIVGLALSIMLMSCVSTAKPVDRTYSETVNVSGVSKDDLFMKANLWFNDTFQGPNPDLTVPFTVPEKSKVTAADRNSGTIQGKYTFLTDQTDAYGMYQIWMVYTDVQLQVSDGQYRLVFSNPTNGAATYTKSENRWIISTVDPLYSKYVKATHNTWQELASALRDTVGGTLASNR